MHSALLPNGKIITAVSYDESLHGVRLNCMDKSCMSPVFHVPGTPTMSAHFKTSGKGASIHKQNCGFGKKLTFQETVSKVDEYQASFQGQGLREFVVRLNMNKLDPDFEAKESENLPKEKEDSKVEELDSEVLKEDTKTPKSIGSLKSVKKLFMTVEPDLLASIIVAVNGKRIPISELIRSYEAAHLALWNDTTLDVPYFIHGIVERVIRRDKVWYINFKQTDSGFFSLIVFDRHFKHFTLKDEELIGKEVLAFGLLKKNTYSQDRKSTEMIIKSNQYIEFL